VDAIKSAKAEYGIVVHDQYGVDWGDSITVNLVESYNFRVSTAVYAADGTLVWRFVSRGRTVDSNVLNYGSLEATNATAGLANFIAYYPELEESLIADDAAGRPHPDEGSGVGKYKGKKEQEIGLLIVNDKSNFVTFSDIR
jgi:hypothetical protein